MNFPIIRGGRLSILLLDKSMVLRLLVSFCNSEGNWREGFTARRIPDGLTSPAPPPLSRLIPRSAPSQSHLGQPTVLKLKDTSFLRGFHVSAEGTVSHPSAAAPVPAGRQCSCHRWVQARSHPSGLPAASPTLAGTSCRTLSLGEEGREGQAARPPGPAAVAAVPRLDAARSLRRTREPRTGSHRAPKTTREAPKPARRFPGFRLRGNAP